MTRFSAAGSKMTPETITKFKELTRSFLQSRDISYSGKKKKLYAWNFENTIGRFKNATVKIATWRMFSRTKQVWNLLYGIIAIVLVLCRF